jgi:hypothetical protein
MLRQHRFIELVRQIFQFHTQHVQHASGDVLNLEVNPLCIIYIYIYASYGKLVFLHTLFIPLSGFPP